jgi:hypothetical protein
MCLDRMTSTMWIQVSIDMNQVGMWGIVFVQLHYVQYLEGIAHMPIDQH